MKISFNKICVLWVIIVTTAYAFYVVFTGACPPDAVTYCLFGICGIELVMTMRIYIKGESLLDKIKDYFNGENAEAIAEKLIGVELKKGK